MSGRRFPFWRYTAFQIPGWVIATATSWWLYQSMNIPALAALAIPVFWFVKDMALYPLLRTAYETDETPPVQRFIGECGMPIERLAPSGYVRIKGELWRAEAEGDPIEPDVTVKVIGAKGLVLRVQAAPTSTEQTR
tara:strand:+ start:511 stop:918 length:408 start_codon:yes stop_codon:yes gene_type:complete